MESGLYSNLVLQYLKKIKKRVYSNSTKEQKNALSERYIKHLKQKLSCYMTHFNTHSYINILQDIV